MHAWLKIDVMLNHTGILSVSASKCAYQIYPYVAYILFTVDSYASIRDGTFFDALVHVTLALYFNVVNDVD